MRIVRVTGGVDTHADTHVATTIDDNGVLRLSWLDTLRAPWTKTSISTT